MARPITRFESSSNSIFVLFVSFVVAFAPPISSQSLNHYLALRNSNRRGGSLVMVRW
jgi:hypothetical protein